MENQMALKITISKPPEEGDPRLYTHLCATPRERKALADYGGQNFGPLCTAADTKSLHTTYLSRLVDCPICLERIPAGEAILMNTSGRIARRTEAQAAQAAKEAAEKATPAPARVAAPAPAQTRPAPVPAVKKPNVYDEF